MASSGSLLSNGWYSSSKGDYIYLEFAWSVSSTSIAENYKDIYWELRGKRTASGYVKSGGFQVVIDGETVYDKSTDYRIELRNGTVVASGTKRLWHNSDGTRSFPVHIEGAIYWDNKNVSGDATFYLDTIPRQATITAAPDFTDMDNPTITYSNPAGDAVTTLDACISFTGERDDIAYRAIPKTWSSYQFPLTEAERNVLRSNTTGPSRTVTFFVRSVIGGVTYWSTIPKTLYIADSEATRPTVSMTLSPVNNLGAKFNGLYIQGKSKVKAELKIDLKYGATEDAVGVNVEGVDYGTPYESGYLKHSGNQVVKSAVRDSRGIYGTHDVGIYVIAYSKPLVVPLSGENAIQCYRSDANGNRIGNSTSLWIKAGRSYYDVQGKNTCALEWRWKPATDQWDDSKHSWSNLIPKSNTTTHEFNSAISGVVFELKKSYTVQIRAVDDIGEVDVKTFDVPTLDVALHLGKGGKNVSIGTYCNYSEERTFYSAWKAIFGGGVFIGDKTLKEYIIDVINGGG